MVQAIVKDPIFPGRKSRDATAADLPAANRKTEHTGRGASPGPCVRFRPAYSLSFTKYTCTESLVIMTDSW